MCSKMSKFVENAEKTAKFCEKSVEFPELLQLFIHADWIIPGLRISSESRIRIPKYNLNYIRILEYKINSGVKKQFLSIFPAKNVFFDRKTAFSIKIPFSPPFFHQQNIFSARNCSKNRLLTQIYQKFWKFSLIFLIEILSSEICRMVCIL